MQCSHEFIRKRVRHKMICFVAMLSVCVFFVICVVDTVNRIHLAQLEEDIECTPFALDRNVLQAVRVSTVSVDEIALKRYFHDL